MRGFVGGLLAVAALAVAAAPAPAAESGINIAINQNVDGPSNAKRLKETWEGRYSGPEGVGRIAVLGDGLKFEQVAMTSDEAQLVEQLKYTAEVVCSTYHVPPYKIGVGTMPTYANIQSLNVEYYSQCLQKHIEDIELCLDEGLGIGEGVSVNGQTLGVEFDVDNLLRMDSATQMGVA